MPKYEFSLQDYLDYQQMPVLPEDILQIIFLLVKTLKQLHSFGYTHNDIKPDNIMLSTKFEVRLIDFGFAKKYVDSSNNHIKETMLDNF